MNKLDFNTIEFATNPDKLLATIRAKEGLCKYQIKDGPEVWLITRRKDAEEVLLNGLVFKVSPALTSQTYDNNPFSIAIPIPSHLLATDDDIHKRLREPMERFFTPKILETYRQYIFEETNLILKNWKAGENHNLVSEISYLIPVKVISKMLGLQWQNEFPEYAVALQLVKSNPEYLEKVVVFHQILKQAIQEKKVHLEDQNMISVLLKAGLSDDEVLSMSLLTFIAGSGTTASLISQGLLKVITDKAEIYDALSSQKLVNEILFHTSPANSAFPRYIHKDIILGGEKLKKGDIAIVVLSSANYDLQEDKDPLKNYLSFSKGIHHCIGWYIAKMQAEIVFEEFYKYFPKTVLIKETWFSNIISRDLITLKVKLK